MSIFGTQLGQILAICSAKQHSKHTPTRNIRKKNQCAKDWGGFWAGRCQSWHYSFFNLKKQWTLFSSIFA